MNGPIATRSGILLIDKPQGLTSHDVVARVRRLAGTRKVGHAGTLDPMATGLLVLGLNSSTRLLTFLVGLDKEYTATIRLGRTSTTDDAEGVLGPETDTAAVTDDDLARGIADLTGAIEQRPSAVSAIKVDGRRAYDRVRAGEAVELSKRPVTVHEFERLATRRDGSIDLDVRVVCSSGTYIRALARDLGESLGVGGHLTALRRTRVGPFAVADAADLEQATAESLAATLRTPADTAATLFPVAMLDADQARDLANGKRITVGADDGGPVAAIAPSGALVGLVAVAGGSARPIVNFPPEEALAPAEEPLP